MSSKENNFKEQFKQALISTAKVISEDYKLDIKKLDKDLSNKKTDFFDITNLSNKNDFVRLRAETDSGALKKKFSNKEIFNKNLPNNPSCKSLYNIAEKIRYELLGGKMLKGVGKNLSENYSQKILSNRKEQLKNKEDVPVTEAFELYMLNKFFKLELNDVSTKMLNFWKKEFDEYIDKHFDFLSKNLEDQNNATHTLDTMLKRFPRSLYKPEALYMYYRMALKQNNVRLAQKMVTQLKDSFSQSKWAMLVKPSAEQDWNVQNQKKLQQQYDAVYTQVNDRNFDSALVAINTINLDKYTDTMKQRIYLLKAISYVGLHNYVTADSFFKSVKPFIKHQPLSDWVMAVEQQINAHVKQDTITKQTSIKNSVSYSFSNDTNVVFNVVIYTTLKESLANALKASIKLWNTNTIKSNTLKVEGIKLANGIHIIYVSAFSNLSSCTQYISNLTNSILMKQIPASDYAMYPISNLNYSSITKPEQWISYFEFWKANFLRK